ncbi:MAG: hypothetical protein WCA16_12355 [Candidatus Sulfotelmatobacter sp.]
MVGLRLMRLIERHSEQLAVGVTEKLRESERTRDFRTIAPEELLRTTAEVYCNLGEWLLRKTEQDIKERFRAIARRRAAEGVGLHQFVWALIISRNYLWEFLQEQAFADNFVALYGELELQLLLNQFFDRALYFGVMGYAETRDRDPATSDFGPNAEKHDEMAERFAGWRPEGSA